LKDGIGTAARDFRKELETQTSYQPVDETAPGLLSSTPVKLNCTADQFLFEFL
jgi:hypothetical protein